MQARGDVRVARATGAELLGHVRALFRGGTPAGLNDAELLRRFAAGDRDDAERAFAALVDRHGPLVLRTCRGLLRDPHDADDAFQATFLVLARRAGRLWVGDSIAPWLHAVARRVAIAARADVERRRLHERRAAAMAGDRVATQERGPDDLAAIVHEEVARLPGRDRLAVVLCDLQGLTYESAASQLGWPLGTIKSRLSRARERLRARLARRGVTAPLALLAATAAASTSRAAVTADLAARAVRLALFSGPPGPTIHRIDTWAHATEQAMNAATIARAATTTLALAALLAVGAGGVLALGPADRDDPPPAAQVKPAAVPASRAQAPAEHVARRIAGIVRGPDGEPVADAMVILTDQQPEHRHALGRSGTDGRFSFPIDAIGTPPDRSVSILAVKDGYAPGSAYSGGLEVGDSAESLEVRLAPPAVFAGRVVDGEGRPIAGARVTVQYIPGSEKDAREGARLNWPALASTPIADRYRKASDAEGLVRFDAVTPGSRLMLVIEAPGMATLDTGRRALRGDVDPYVVGTPDQPATIALDLEARIVGRVVTKLPGVDVGGIRVHFAASDSSRSPWLGGETVTDDQGRFQFDRIGAGEVVVGLYPRTTDGPWAARGVKGVQLTPGATAEVEIELIEGVLVEGKVVDAEEGRPIAGASVGRAGVGGMMTGDDGAFRFRVPPGEATFYLSNEPEGYKWVSNEGSRMTVDLPTDRKTFELPPFQLSAAVPLYGTLVDALGRPAAGAQVAGVCEGEGCSIPGGVPPAGRVGADGRFQLSGPFGRSRPDRKATLLVRLTPDREYPVAVLPNSQGRVEGVLPADALEPPAQAPVGPADVAPDELAGVVVDEDGRPVEGAVVDAWMGRPGNEATTGADGTFRLKGFGRELTVPVEIRKEGYAPRLYMGREAGATGWVVTLDDDTWFEGRVTRRDHTPVAGALVRANRGPKLKPPYGFMTLWTEATTGADGRYIMKVEADVYDIQVRVPGVGVDRRPAVAIAADEVKTVDPWLRPGPAFVAKVVDSLSGEPVAGFKLGCNPGDYPGVEGTSGADGVVRIADLVPGLFDFRRITPAPGYARWWSEQAANPYERKTINPSIGGGNWQRNFDGLSFDLRPDAEPVTIVAELGATIRGRVLDPDGKPVAGATVDPTRTGSASPLSGDSRFSVATDAEGRYEVVLPASGDREYNLLAHDGAIREWRTWANGVTDPFRTRPGDVREGVDITLTRPGTIRGRVVDPDGKPVEGREVSSRAADGRENGLYNPTAITATDGTFTLAFVRPGEQVVQVAPNWFLLDEAPRGTIMTVPVEAGGTVEGVELVARPPGNGRN